MNLPADIGWMYLAICVVWLLFLSFMAAVEQDDANKNDAPVRRQEHLDKAKRFSRYALAAPVWPLALVWGFVIRPLYLLVKWLLTTGGLTGNDPHS